MSLQQGYVISDLEKYFRHRHATMHYKLDNNILTNAEREYYSAIAKELTDILERFFQLPSRIIYHDFAFKLKSKNK